MISSISVENFKAFGKKQKLPIKPITIIFGPNSSGKSSIIHNLLFVQHALETGELDVFRTKGGGDSVDLGGFKQFIFGGINRNDLLTWSAEIKTKDMKGRILELLAPADSVEISVSVRLPQEEPEPGKFVFAVKPVVTSYIVSADGKDLFSMGIRGKNILRMERINYQHPIFRKLFKDMIEAYTTIQNVQSEDLDYLKEIIAELVPNLHANADHFIPDGLLKTESEKTIDPMLMAVGKSTRKEDIQKAVELFLPRILNDLLEGLSNMITSQFQGLAYLGPLRSYPSRHLAFLESEDHNWYAGGGFAWEVLRKDQLIRDRVNQWLGDKNKLQTPYRLELKDYVSYEDLISDYVGEIEEIEHKFFGDPPEIEAGKGDMFGELYEVLSKIKKSSKGISEIKELYLKDLRTDTTVSHRDVGIGISQIVPVLVNAYASQNKMITIEQPEIHIHPGLQAELGDLFIESALGENNNTFILETHSEHLILRILRRIRETTRKIYNGSPQIKPEDISLIFVDSTKNGSIIKSLRVDAHGRIIDKVPGGFFEEDFKELF